MTRDNKLFEAISEVLFAPDSPFPVAHISQHANAWSIPDSLDFYSMPLDMSDAQLQASVLMIWKQYMLHDEILSAIIFLENAPYSVRHSLAIEKALQVTKDFLHWAGEKPIIDQASEEPTAYEMSRMHLVASQLPPRATLINLGNFSHYYAQLGHHCVELRGCVNTAANEIVNEDFDYVASVDRYEYLADPVNELLLPVKKILKEEGKLLLVTSFGALFRGKYIESVAPWKFAKQGENWLKPYTQPRLVAPSVWSVAAHFRQAQYWVKDCYVDMCSDGVSTVEGQGNIVVQAWKTPPVKYNQGLDIVFYVGIGVDAWSPVTVHQKGQGGSEMMALELSKRLALMGHKVRVYNSCGEVGEGIYDGVEYRSAEKYQDLVCDVLIVLRQAVKLSDNFNIQAKLKLLYVHDAFIVGATPELLDKADKVIVLSNWHKQHIMQAYNLHSEKIILTRNGIEPEKFDNTMGIVRDQFKCLNATSPDRSWFVLLDFIWPRIKARVPQASLVLAYGFDIWKFFAQRENKQDDLVLIAYLENKIKEMGSLGVEFVGRVGQKELVREYLSSGVFLYPGSVSETSYIGGMECQAAGVRFIGSALGAIPETVGERGTLISGKADSAAYQDQFVEAAVKALLNDDNGDREKLQRYARDHFSLDALAHEWDAMLQQLMVSVVLAAH